MDNSYIRYPALINNFLTPCLHSDGMLDDSSALVERKMSGPRPRDPPLHRKPARYKNDQDIMLLVSRPLTSLHIICSLLMRESSLVILKLKAHLLHSDINSSTEPQHRDMPKINNALSLSSKFKYIAFPDIYNFIMSAHPLASLVLLHAIFILCLETDFPLFKMTNPHRVIHLQYIKANVC